MELEWLAADGIRQSFVLEGAHAEGTPIERIRPGQIFTVKTPFVPCPGELIRKAYSEGDKVILGGD
jgi:hypothetical protein